MRQASSLCVVGAGRLGRVLAVALAVEFDVRVLSRRSGTISTPAGAALAVTVDPRVIVDADVVLLALPEHEMDTAVTLIRSHLGTNTLVLNLATDVPTDRISKLLPGRRVIGCKIVGQSGEIGRGSRAAVVVSGAARDEFQLICRIMSVVGDVVEGDESMVLQTNRIVAEHMIAAADALERDLAALGLPELVRAAALGNVAVGSLRALVSGTAGPFLRRVLSQRGA